MQARPSSWNPHSNAITRKRARDSLIDQEKVNAEVDSQPEPRERNGLSEPQAAADNKIGGSANSENEVEMLAISASRSVTVTGEHPSIMDYASKEVCFRDSASSSREKSPEIAPGSPMKIDVDFPNEISESFADSGTSDIDIIMGSGTPPIKNPDDSRLSKSIPGDLQTEVAPAEITPAKFYRKSFTNQAESYIQKSQNKIEELSREAIIVDSHDKQPRFV